MIKKQQQNLDLSLQGIEQVPLKVFAEKAYLDYSMYVILDRALPHIGDGLKPVQRRIIYAMAELHLSNNAKHKKSARTIGDVLGKFHPHGDTACYEAMVLMAQNFSYRYPTVDGQGNWGSIDDPKSFAAMRYTEARLARYSDIFLTELDQGTVEWQPNFDGTLKEPLVLPAAIPNLLLNGVTGIAVGMVTDIPPHNLREVAAACIHLLKNPRATIAELCEILPGPDFPTKAEIITPHAELLEMYTQGHGSCRMRATYVVEDGEIIITALPYQVSGAKILEQIAEQMQAKKLPMVQDLRDESDHENPVRLVIIPRSNRVDITELMSHLFVTTDLEKSYKANFNVIGLDGRPQVKNLRDFLQEWLKFRRDTITKRLQHRLDAIIARLHILAGLLLAYLNLDKVIAIVRSSDDPAKELMTKFKLSAEQVAAILELKLRHLAKLEETKLRAEQKELAQEQQEHEELLHSPNKLTAYMVKDIETWVTKFGDDRRSKLVVREEAKILSIEQRVPVEAVTVVISQQGWIRAAKGHDVVPQNLPYKSGDAYLTHAYGKSNMLVYLLDTTGRSYSVAAHTLPSARSQGEPITSKITLPEGGKIHSLIIAEDTQKILVLANNGYGFVTNAADLATKNKTGKAILKLDDDSQALGLVLLPATIADTKILFITKQGYALLVKCTEIPELQKGKGNKLINVPRDLWQAKAEAVVSAIALTASDVIILEKANGKQKLLTMAELAHYAGVRGRRGNKLPKHYDSDITVRVQEQLPPA